MKSLKKLITASLMLVVAFVGVVASTFAWFTMQNQVDVDDIQLNVGTAGYDLQISLDNIVFGYNVELLALPAELELIPVTYQEFVAGTWSFKTLDLTEGVYDYAETTPMNYNYGAGQWDGLATASYITFDLFFKSSDALVVKFDVEEFEAGLLSANIAGGALRIMFDDGAETIYEPFYKTAYDNDQNLNGTFGVGEFFKLSRGFIANKAFDAFLLKVEEDYTLAAYNDEDHYQINSTVVPYSVLHAGEVASDTELLKSTYIDITTTTAGDAKQVSVTIWLEGWDGDATNDISAASLIARLLFVGEIE